MPILTTFGGMPMKMGAILTKPIMDHATKIDTRKSEKKHTAKYMKGRNEKYTPKELNEIF
jgi:hypothetical protein